MNVFMQIGYTATRFAASPLRTTDMTMAEKWRNVDRPDRHTVYRSHSVHRRRKNETFIAHFTQNKHITKKQEHEQEEVEMK